ncbi:MAG: hypothetical protein WBP52_08710 [Terriglobales bacterium]
MPTWSFQNSEWRQGAIIPRELVPDGILPPEIGTGAKAIIISHDCDIVQPSSEAEPYIEFLIAQPLPDEQKDGTLFRGRNSRKLQLWVESDGKRQLYEISAHDRFRMERRLLEYQEPHRSINLDGRSIATLAAWFAKRYKRSSFPTAFNNRIPEKIWKKIKKALKRDGDDVLIFMGMSSVDELPPETPYQVFVRVVVPRDALQNDLREQNALAVVAALRTYLSQCEGIEVIDTVLVSEAEFSFEDYLYNTIEWDTFDYLSVPPNSDN